MIGKVVKYTVKTPKLNTEPREWEELDGEGEIIYKLEHPLNSTEGMLERYMIKHKDTSVRIINVRNITHIIG